MNDINLFKTKDSIYLRKVFCKSEISKEDLCDGYLIEASESEARRITDSLKGSGKLIAIMGRNDAFNRRVAEHLKIDFLVSPEKYIKLDSLKQRDSGINHVVAKILRKNRISLVVNIHEVSKLKGIEMSARIARIIQNIKICRKVGCKILIGSLSNTSKQVVNELGRKSFGLTLGMSSKEAHDSVFFD